MTTTLIHPEKSVSMPLEILKALANDVRFEIISILAQRECCVCDLEVLLSMNQSKVSYHLAALRDVGLILGETRGKNSYYRLERNALYQLGGQLLEVLLRPRPDLGMTHQTESMC
jgi:ArsR family transcriptional regulator, arsenate/arsenite/antimonite-responsive transcriptional repressor